MRSFIQEVQDSGLGKVNKRKATLPPAQRAYGPEGTVNSKPVNAYGEFMSIKAFWVICMGGFLATYAHLVFALLAGRMGMARLDYGEGLSTLLFGESYEGKPPYVLGLTAVHLNGIIFALLYASVAGPYLPGAPLVRGLLWGGVLFVFSQCFFNPVVAGHGMFAHKLHPRAWQTSLIAHAIYGAAVGWLCPIL